MKIARGNLEDGRSHIIVFAGEDDAYDVTSTGGPGSIAGAMCAYANGSLLNWCSAAAAIPKRNFALRAPIDEDARILCAGFNYVAHAGEAAREVPSHPTFFTRYASSLVGPDEPIILPQASSMLDWEGEVAFVIGKGGRAIPAADASDHVGGYVCFGDHSVRDFQLHGTQATAGKNFDRTGAIGPFIVTPDEAPIPKEMELSTWLNGERMQHGHVADLVFDVPTLIAYVSIFMALRPGDVIATGTPSGIGGRMTPPRWLRPGEMISVDVPGLGSLSNPVIAEEQAS